MAAYRIQIKHSAFKELSRLQAKIGLRLLDAIQSLLTDPRPRQSKKLKGAQAEGAYRVRVGDYRIVYDVDDDLKLVTVYRIGHRREVYR